MVVCYGTCLFLNKCVWLQNSKTRRVASGEIREEESRGKFAVQPAIPVAVIDGLLMLLVTVSCII